MRILIVAATAFEIEGVKDVFREQDLLADNTSAPSLLTTHHSLSNTHHSPLTIHYLVTGVGMVATAFATGNHLAKNEYDLAINLGIAGSFDREIVLGDVIEITADSITELGAEDDEQFLTIESLGFGESKFAATTSLTNLFKDDSIHLEKATAITVNTVHGNEKSIASVVRRTCAKIESMEGAAFFYACKQYNLPCLQIRAVSNYVEKRNRANWQIGLAIKNLNSFAVSLLERLQEL